MMLCGCSMILAKHHMRWCGGTHMQPLWNVVYLPLDNIWNDSKGIDSGTTPY